MKKDIIIIGGLVGATLTDFLGGLDINIKFIAILVISDYLLGVINALLFNNSPKTENGGLSSEVGYKGIVKKLVIFMFIGFMHYVDVMFSTNDFFRNATCYGFIANELISIVETVGLMGIIELPTPIINAIELLKNKSNNKE